MSDTGLSLFDRAFTMQSAILIFMVLITAGFVVVPIAATIAAEGVLIKRPPPPLTIYDKIARNMLRGLGLIIIVIKLPIVFNIVVPAPGFEWLDRTELIFAALLFIFAGDALPKKFEAEADGDPHALLKTRLFALAWTVLALAALYATATRFFGE